jgi:ADP-ribosylglycohydrolase
MGGAIADALGWPTEFSRSPEDLKQVGVHTYPVHDFVPWHKRTGGRFFTRIDNIQPGDYSDDTQLTLSVARSLNADGTVDNEYFAKKELQYWLDYARGAGATVTAAAKAASRRSTDWRWNFFRFKRGRHYDLDYRGAGANGAAMRVSPIALANLHDRHQTMVEVLDYMCAFAEEAEPPLGNPDIGFWLSRWNAEGNQFGPQWSETKEEMKRLLSFALKSRSLSITEAYRGLGCFEPATKGSGTVTAATAIMLFLREGNNFVRLAREAANVLGSDTDTIGAMAASLAGGWLGYMELPERWASLMADYTYINRAAEAISLIALRRTEENPLRLRPKTPTAIGDLLDALKRQVVVEHHRYRHPLLGEGKVLKVESQEVGRPKVKGRVIMATVKFDFGQTCKFSSYTGLPSRKRRNTQ